MKRKLLFAVSLLLVILVFCGCAAAGPRSVSGTVVKVTADGYLVLLEQCGREALSCETVPLSREQLPKQDGNLHIGDEVQLEYRRVERNDGAWQLSGLKVADRGAPKK